jgi:hypothetical protein
VFTYIIQIPHIQVKSAVRRLPSALQRFTVARAAASFHANKLAKANQQQAAQVLASQMQAAQLQAAHLQVGGWGVACCFHLHPHRSDAISLSAGGTFTCA